MDYEAFIEEQLNQIDMSPLEQLINEVAGQSQGYFEPLSLNEIVYSILEGRPLFDSEVMISGFIDLFLFEIRSGIALGVQLVIICVVIGLLTNLSNSFGEKTVSSLGILVCSCFVIALCLRSFTYTYNLAADCVNMMAITMQILLPVLIPLMISTGSFTSGSILNPVILGAITVFNTLLQKFILPAIFISAIFILVNSMTDRDYVNKLAKFIRGAAIFTTGLAVTFFAGITMIQGVVTQSADGLLINTARYSISNFVPIVGGFAADSIDMVLGCIRIIKTGVGIFGVIILVCLLVIPLIKIIAIAVIYKLTAIIIEPIGNKQVSNAMNEMGNSVITMAVILFLTSLMFLIFMAIIIGIGGGRLWR